MLAHSNIGDHIYNKQKAESPTDPADVDPWTVALMEAALELAKRNDSVNNFRDNMQYVVRQALRLLGPDSADAKRLQTIMQSPTALIQL